MPESRAAGTSPPEIQTDKRQNKPANKHEPRRNQQTTWHDNQCSMAPQCVAVSIDPCRVKAKRSTSKTIRPHIALS